MQLMRITGSKSSENIASAPPAKRKQSLAGGASSSPSSDTTELSVVADRLLGGRPITASDHAQHLEALSADFQAGRYSIDAYAVSRAIISFSFEV